MKNRIIVLSIFLFATQVILAQRVSMETARLKAEAFFGQSAQAKSANGENRRAMELKLAEDSTDLYIFNDAKNGGYVVMSSDERMPEVLGYSKEGCYNAKNVPPGLKDLLDQYKRTTMKLRENPKLKLPKTTTYTNTTVVEPLIKTKWGQSWPYNGMCPIEEDGERCVTGCVNTAFAQIMYYHKWPRQGKGYVSYEWNDRLLYAYLNKSTYQWDEMRTAYASYSKGTSCDAVALLMRDLGICMKTSYGARESCAYSDGYKLVEHFDYDPTMAVLNREVCDEIAWDSIITNELKHSRPMEYDAHQVIGKGHAFILDGRDASGYYHFNFGWEGLSDGYYTTKGICYNQKPEIFFGIMKNKNRDPRENAYFYAESGEDFKYTPSYDNMKLRFYFCGRYYDNIESALAVEDTITHQIRYTDYSDDEYREIFQMKESLPDGNYKLYPVCRLNENDRWHKLLFHDDLQTYVELNVSKGKYTYTNKDDFPIQEGAVCVNGIYYFLNNHSAHVTYKNTRYNSYYGDVTIPSKFTYKDKEYTVCAIDEEAFKGSTIGTLTIPNTVYTAADFSDCSIGRIVFEKYPQFSTITGRCFQNTKIRSGELTIPNNVSEFPEKAFKNAEIPFLTLPSQLMIIRENALENIKKLRNLVVKAQKPIPFWQEIPEFDLYHRCTLYVPKGSLEEYRKANFWKDFTNIVEFSGEQRVMDNLLYMMNDLDHTARIISSYDFKDKVCRIPSTLIYNKKEYTVKQLLEHSFSIKDSKIEEVIIPNTVEKIGEGCFNELKTLKTLRIDRQEPPAAINTSSYFDNDIWPICEDAMQQIITLYVPVGCKKKYASHSFWGKFSHIIEDETLGINEQPVSNSWEDKAVYTLNGIRVPAAKSKEKSKGIYVQEGKKIIN